MNQSMRKILATLAGVITGGIVVFLFETISHMVVPPPDGIDISDVTSMNEYMKVAPLPALLMVVAGWVMACFSGGYVAGLINKMYLISSVFTGFILLAFSILNMTSFYHPVWMWVVALVCMVPAAWLGGKLSLRR